MTPQRADTYIPMHFEGEPEFNMMTQIIVKGATTQKKQACIFLETPAQQTRTRPRLRLPASISHPWQKAMILLLRVSQKVPVSISVVWNQRKLLTTAILKPRNRQRLSPATVPVLNTTTQIELRMLPRAKSRIMLLDHTGWTRQQRPITMSPRQMTPQMAKKGPGGVTIKLNFFDTSAVFLPVRTETAIITRTLTSASSCMGKEGPSMAASTTCIFFLNFPEIYYQSPVFQFIVSRLLLLILFRRQPDTQKGRSGGSDFGLGRVLRGQQILTFLVEHTRYNW